VKSKRNTFKNDFSSSISEQFSSLKEQNDLKELQEELRERKGGY